MLDIIQVILWNKILIDGFSMYAKMLKHINGG